MFYDPQRHRRRSIRLKGYDYAAPGAYYVTICSRTRGEVFGRIVNGLAQLGEVGQLVEQRWRSIPQHFPHTSLDAWVVMPDHLHGIIVINRREWAVGPSYAKRPRGTVPGSLPAIIQNFKAASARDVNRLRKTPGHRHWQEDYYEHIIREQADLNRIRRYIETNPARWRG